MPGFCYFFLRIVLARASNSSAFVFLFFFAQQLYERLQSISDIEIMERIDFDKAKMVISTAPSFETNMLVIKHVRKVNPKLLVFVTAYNVNDALAFYNEGADYVILPHFLGGDYAALILEDVSSDINNLLSTKFRHIKELKHRLRLGHRHPTKELH